MQESFNQKISIVNELGETKRQVGNLTEELSLIKTTINELKEQVIQLSSSQVSPPLYNILLFGRTGKGKSTLANVLSDSDEFKESFGMASQTCDFQAKSFS
jgi:predicted GTPase